MLDNYTFRKVNSSKCFKEVEVLIQWGTIKGGKNGIPFPSMNNLGMVQCFINLVFKFLFPVGEGRC